MNSLILFVRNVRIRITSFSEAFLNRSPFFPEFSLAEYTCPLSALSQTKSPQSILEDIIDNGFLWGVPKARRSLERRMTRRMGFGKVLIPKKSLIVCETCGHFHPHHTVCGNCYEKVKIETELMQEAIFKELKLDPIDKEVFIVYENDPKERKAWEGKRIIEVPKERPAWFSKNLLTKDSEIPRKKSTSISDSSITPKVENL